MYPASATLNLGSIRLLYALMAKAWGLPDRAIALSHLEECSSAPECARALGIAVPGRNSKCECCKVEGDGEYTAC